MKDTTFVTILLVTIVSALTITALIISSKTKRLTKRRWITIDDVADMMCAEARGHWLRLFGHRRVDIPSFAYFLLYKNRIADIAPKVLNRVRQYNGRLFYTCTPDDVLDVIHQDVK